MERNIQEFLEFNRFLTRLSEESGEIIRRYYLSSRLQVDLKADRSLVTQADKEAESVIRDLVRKSYPDHGIIGEEFGSEKPDAEFVWVVDPIDGTISFVSGVPLFGSLIGLLYRGSPVLGAIHQPVTRLLCIGDGVQTSCNGQVIQVRDCKSVADMTMLATDLASIAKFKNFDRFEDLRKETKLFRTWGDCYGYLLVAMGKADVMLDPIMNPWDILPVIPVIEGAGGKISGWEGQDARLANSCVAAAAGVHAEVVARLM